MNISLTDVYILWHTHDLTDDFGTHEEVKLIHKNKMDQPGWIDGFFTAHWPE